MASSGTIIIPPYDLTTVLAVKTFISGTGTPSVSTTDDSNIQNCITALGIYVMWRTGQMDSDGDIPPVSPFIQPLFYDEWYDGNGNDRMFLRHSPVRSVSLLEVSGVTIPLSTGGYNSTGFVVDSNGRSLVIRARSGGPGLGNYGTYAISPLRSVSYGGFCYGTQNVHVQYLAGYNNTPFDLTEACTRAVAQNYKRRAWIDLRSVSNPLGGGATIYRDWKFEPYVESVFENYTRKSFN